MATVTITNTQWNSMNLQVRVGSNPNPESNPLVFNQPLVITASYNNTFPVFLYYRRDTDPDNPNGQFTGWTQCFTDQIIDNP